MSVIINFTISPEGVVTCTEGVAVDPFQTCDKPWCEHQKAWLQSGADHVMLKPGRLIEIPLFTKDEPLFPRVQIGPDQGDGLCELRLVHTFAFGTYRSDVLTYWSPGEGRLSIRRTLYQWLITQFPDELTENFNYRLKVKCPEKVHTVTEENQLRLVMPLQERIRNLYYLTVEQACYYCVKKSQSFAPSDPAASPPPWARPGQPAHMITVIRRGNGNYGWQCNCGDSRVAFATGEGAGMSADHHLKKVGV